MRLAERLSHIYHIMTLRQQTHAHYFGRNSECRVALGYARTRPGVGGVRNHLNCIQRYSNFNVDLFPSQKFCERTAENARWQRLSEAICGLPLHRFGVLHSHVNPDFIAACSVAHKRGTPWVHTYHTIYLPEDWGGQLQQWQLKTNKALVETASRADVRISVSPWLSELLEERHGISTIVIPNGVDVDKCVNAIPLQQREHFPDFKPYVLFSGSLSEVKNPCLFIRLAQCFPEIAFVMIGRGLEQDSVREFYGNELPANLRLVGPVDHELALSFTRSALALVVTSHSEGLPTAVMEAMAIGRPVVVPNSFGCKDLVTNGETGFVFEPSSIESLIAQFELAIGDETVGVNAKHLIRERYAWPRVIDRLDEIYKGFLT